jgi:glucose-6-phosphate isomerase
MSATARDAAWRALAAHRHAMAPRRMRELFASDPQRFDRFSGRLGDLLIDYSKHRITAETMALLTGLAEAAEVPRWIERMFAGEAINVTEGRPVLHVALRNRANTPILVDGADVMPKINAELTRMGAFAEAVRAGERRGHGGEAIRAVVNIGIGGSDLGPRMAVAALAADRHPDLDMRFAANVDPSDLAEALRGLDPGRTLVVVASKTFTTAETMANADAARAWLRAGLGDKADLSRHLVAVTARPAAARAYGVGPANIFEFWDWVGGRYSLWSAVGLPVALAVGMDKFVRMLEGAHQVDQHFRRTPLEKNLPVILALLGVWYIDVLGAETHAVLPYDERLRFLPAYLQQADMESNGKSVGLDGRPVGVATAPIVWGGTGTNSQHAFFQLLHQGTHLAPADFIAAARGEPHDEARHQMLMANFIAQSAALMQGRTADEAKAENQAAHLAHRVFPGDRPSTSIMLPRLDAFSLGALIALYEHKIFVQGVIWGLSSFDQWGVELGKGMASGLLDEIRGSHKVGAQSARGAPGSHDSSTAGLLRYYRDHCGKS